MAKVQAADSTVEACVQTQLGMTYKGLQNGPMALSLYMPAWLGGDRATTTSISLGLPFWELERDGEFNLVNLSGWTSRNGYFHASS